MRQTRGAVRSKRSVEKIVPLVGSNPLGLWHIAIEPVPNRDAHSEHRDEGDGHQGFSPHVLVPKRSSPLRSESLEVLEKGSFLLQREFCSVARAFVARIVVTIPLCIEWEEVAPILLGDIGDETDVLAIIDVVAAVEEFGPRRCRL